MTKPPTLRQEQILTWLQKEQRITIEALAERLGVSIMTIHRDLDALARTGKVEKVRGAVQVATRGMPGEAAHQCALCAMPVPPRTSFMINTASGQQVYGCCPHCGLLLLERHPDTTLVLTRDFLYGRMVNAGDATYLIDSAVVVCCSPSVLCFAGEQDARRFQQGFGGSVLDFESARDYLVSRHRGSESVR